MNFLRFARIARHTHGGSCYNKRLRDFLNEIRNYFCLQFSCNDVEGTRHHIQMTDDQNERRRCERSSGKRGSIISRSFKFSFKNSVKKKWRTVCLHHHTATHANIYSPPVVLLSLTVSHSLTPFHRVYACTARVYLCVWLSTSCGMGIPHIGSVRA